MSQITNRRIVSKEGADFYPTPPWATKALLKYEQFEGSIWEPCCGDGSMSEVLKTTGLPVYSSDLHDRNYNDTDFTLDFLDDEACAIHVSPKNNIITNPPFNIADKILKKALERADKKVCLLLRTAFLEGQKRYNTIFNVNPPARVLIFSERLSMYPKGHKGKNGGTTAYAWFVWDKEYNGDPVIKWIEPGLKE